MIELEVFQNELAVEFHDIETDLWLIKGTPCYTEAAQEAQGNILQRAIKKTKELIQKTKDKVKQFLQDRKFKKMEEAVNKDPNLKNKKVKVPDYDKLHKLNADTLDRLTDKNCDVEKEMAKYKKQRNILLGAGAVATVGIGYLISRCKRFSKDLDYMHDYVDDLKLDNESYSYMIKDLLQGSEGSIEFNNSGIKADSSYGSKLVSKLQKTVEAISTISKTDTECISKQLGYINSVFNSIHEYSKNISDTIDSDKEFLND